MKICNTTAIAKGHYIYDLSLPYLCHITLVPFLNLTSLGFPQLLDSPMKVELISQLLFAMVKPSTASLECKSVHIVALQSFQMFSWIFLNTVILVM